MKCNHAYSMIYDDDYCCCSECEEQWTLTSSGWKSSKNHTNDFSVNKYKSNVYRNKKKRPRKF